MKSPGFLTLAVATFALGVCAATVLFSVTESVLWRALPFAHPERLVVVWEKNLKRVDASSASLLNFADWRRRVQSVEGLAAMGSGDSRNLSSQGTGERVRVKRVSSGLFETLGVQPALGRTFRTDDEHAALTQPLIITDEFWHSHFAGSAAAVGQTLKLDGEPSTVVGVLPAGFHFEFTSDPAVFVPLVMDAPDARRETRELVVIGRIRSGASMAQANAEMQGIARQLASAYPRANGGWSAGVEDLREAFTKFYRRDLFLYLGFAGFVLVIACANVAGLLLVRSVGRQKEFALRTALGARAGDLWRLALAETAWIAVPGGVLGSLLAAWGVSAMRGLLPASMLLRSNGISMDLTALGFVLAVSMASAIAFAAAPAAMASKLNIETALRDGSKSVNVSPRISRRIDGLIAAEITLAFLLLFGAGLFVSSHARLHQVALGFDPHHVLTMRVSTGLSSRAESATMRETERRALEMAASTAGVQLAAVSSDLPLIGASAVHFVPSGQPRPAHGEEPYSLVRAVSPDYFNVMGMRLLQGRAFTDADSGSARRVAIVNQNLAHRIFGDENPVGRSLEILAGGASNVPAGTVLIVGLAPNIKEVDLNEVEFNDIYCPLAQNPVRAFYVAVKTSEQPDIMGPELRRALQSLVPDGAVYDVATMDGRIDGSLAGPRFNLAMVSFFAGLAVLLAAVGVYGAISFSAAQRMREFGLRMALGAGRRSIVGITMARSGRLALVGAACGLVLSLVAGSMLQSALYLVPGKHGGVLYGVGIHDPASLAGSAALMLALASLAAIAPAIRASRVEPLAALRDDG